MRFGGHFDAICRPKTMRICSHFSMVCFINELTHYGHLVRVLLALMSLIGKGVEFTSSTTDGARKTQNHLLKIAH
jgi:hypothetical protein